MVNANWAGGEPPSKDPLADLCELVYRRTGALISTERMREMFVTDWSKLSKLGHAIHERQVRPRMQTANEAAVNEQLKGQG